MSLTTAGQPPTTYGFDEQRPTIWELFAAMTVQFRVIGALTLRDFRLRILGHKFGLLMAIAEPMMFVFVISVAMTFITKSPRIGDSFILFFATGMIPFNAFKRTSRSVRMAERRYRKCLYLPVIRPIDPFVATMIVELILYNCVYLIFFVAHYVIVGNGIPHDWAMTFMPISVNCVFGLGIGLLNSAIAAYFPPWDKIFSILTMPLMIASGTIHTIDSLPSAVVNIIYYNPLAHSVVASRSGFFNVYDSTFYDPYYYLGSTAFVLFLGVVAERYARRRILSSS